MVVVVVRLNIFMVSSDQAFCRCTDDVRVRGNKGSVLRWEKGVYLNESDMGELGE